MHLEDFPMDVHACPLKFGSCKYPDQPLQGGGYRAKNSPCIASVFQYFCNSVINEC